MGETHLLLQLVYSIGHTLVAWLLVFLDHGVLQILLELCVQLWVRSKLKSGPTPAPSWTDRTRGVTRRASARPAWNE